MQTPEAGAGPDIPGPVLVTGGGGFIGSALCARLSQLGVETHAIVRPEGSAPELPSQQIHATDLLDAEQLAATLRQISPAVVVNAAVRHAYAAGSDRLDLAIRDNVLGFACLLEATRPLGLQRLIQLGSFLEYGPCDGPLDETRVLAPRSVRGATKAAATQLALAEMDRQAVAILRIFSVYGPGEKLHRLVPSAIRAALTGEPLRLTAPGFVRDLVFIDDVVEAILLACTSERAIGQTLNIASGREVANEEVVAAVESVVGTRIQIEKGAFASRVTDSQHNRARVDRARELLGWSARHDLESGLSRMVPWVKEQLGRR